MPEKLPIQPVSSAPYWKDRLARAVRMEEIHRAVYETTRDDWDTIEKYQRKVLESQIQPNDSILDVGCAWGRIMSMMPETWKGKYTGIDISPEFIEMGRMTYPQHNFICGDARTHVWGHDERYDWAVICSVEGMLIYHIGADVWTEIKESISRVCHRLLFIDYDLTHRVEVCK